MAEVTPDQKPPTYLNKELMEALPTAAVEVLSKRETEI